MLCYLIVNIIVIEYVIFILTKFVITTRIVNIVIGLLLYYDR